MIGKCPRHFRGLPKIKPRRVQLGALQGTLSYKIFYVQGEIQDDWQSAYLERVRKNAFDPLTPESDEDISEGWVPIDRPLQNEFDLYTFLFDHYINLGFRQDRYAIPSGLLKAHVAEAEREYMLQNEKEKLSKFERDDIKAIVQAELREKQLPRMRVFDMSWDLHRKRVRFWSQSNKLCETFQGFFEDTFGLKILPANPYINAIEQGLDPKDVEKLGVLESANFIDAMPSH